jgi:hypothetical protein
LARALRSGRRGRKFKSCLPDYVSKTIKSGVAQFGQSVPDGRSQGSAVRRPGENLASPIHSLDNLISENKKKAK